MNAVVRSSPLLLLSIVSLLFAQESRAQSVATNPVGYNMFTLPAGYSLRVNTFVQTTAFQGTASAVTNASNSVITLSTTSGAITSGTFNETGSGPSYYVEILDAGSAQGLIADIISNTATTIKVDTNLIPFGTLGTCSFCVRPHTTLSTLFPTATSGFQANTDYMLLYPANSSTPTIFDFTNTGWVDASAGGTPAGNQVVYPGQGFIIYVGTAKTVPVVGCVKPGPTQVPLYSGGVNLVGTINPAVGGTQTLSAFNFPGSLTANTDYVEPFADNGLLQSAGVYYSSGGNMIGGSGNANSLTVNASNSVVVGVTQSKNWIMPSFYTP